MPDDMKRMNGMIGRTAAALLAAWPAALWAASDIAVPGDAVSETEACAAGAAGPAMRLAVTGFKDNKGIVRVQLYPDTPEDYLEKGKRLKRIDVPAPDDENAAAEICMAVPAPGEYAIIVMHDRDGNGKASPFSDGFGLPGEQKMKLRKPKYEEGRVIVGQEVIDIPVKLQYLTGDNRPRGAR